MLYTIMHGKIHRATVTEANLEYMGSVTIDSELMEMAGILPGERVQIVDNNNGARLETYTIAGAPGSGCIRWKVRSRPHTGCTAAGPER